MRSSFIDVLHIQLHTMILYIGRFERTHHAFEETNEKKIIIIII